MVHQEHVISQLQHYFLSKGAERVILFGSFARNTQTRKSDVDLIVIKQTDKRFFDPVGSDPHWCDPGYSIGKKKK